MSVAFVISIPLIPPSPRHLVPTSTGPPYSCKFDKIDGDLTFTHFIVFVNSMPIKRGLFLHLKRQVELAVLKQRN
ncbi:unnamed protein product [Cylicocyclus nassatus]|uniref:Uncharacterized protein n=1 Tax=Cylicocyclus nassatus TaxID=53992 RepID=A0AA36H093_CYLNA|nr:unnamed protein product [Cylicocyclus nassatus]